MTWCKKAHGSVPFHAWFHTWSHTWQQEEIIHVMVLSMERRGVLLTTGSHVCDELSHNDELNHTTTNWNTQRRIECYWAVVWMPDWICRNYVIVTLFLQSQNVFTRKTQRNRYFKSWAIEKLLIVDEQKDYITSLGNENDKLVFEVQLLKKKYGTLFVKKIFNISGEVDIQYL